MSELELDLWALFRGEYIGRLARIRSILDNCHQHGFSVHELDKMHQEFDTIYGACRALGREDLGAFIRLCASFARHLRCQLPATIDADAVALLTSVVTLAEQLKEVTDEDDVMLFCHDPLLDELRKRLTSGASSKYSLSDN
ncbi:MAG: hypothetical protein Q9M31_06125 [Mariprofundus sp.]|nr:hypothetical protein [Mariprofundus sp.]